MIHAELYPDIDPPGEDDATWAQLMDAYIDRLELHGCAPLIDGFRRLHFHLVRVEDIAALSRRTEAAFGWRIEAVDSLIDNDAFVELLRSRTFPVAGDMRRPHEYAFAEFPDFFHDALGHLPLLIHPAYRAFLIEFARVSRLFSHSHTATTALGRLYWHTIEVGLVNERGVLKVFGAAIATSGAECARAMSSETTRIPFDLEMVLAADYSPFALQPKYFVLESFDSLPGITAAMEKTLQRFAEAEAHDH